MNEMDAFRKILAAATRDTLYGIGLVAVIVIVLFASAKTFHFIYAMF
jgi:hypothetical protein